MKKIKGLKITLKDNDFVDILKEFFTDEVKEIVFDRPISYPRSYRYCIGDPKRKLADKEDNNSIKKYVQMSKDIDNIMDKLFEKEGTTLTEKERRQYIKFVKINFYEYVDTLKLNDTTKQYIKENIRITPIDSISLDWQNDEVVYYIFSNEATLVF